MQEGTGAQQYIGMCAQTPGLEWTQCFRIVSADIVLEGETAGGAKAVHQFSVGIT